MILQHWWTIGGLVKTAGKTGIGTRIRLEIIDNDSEPIIKGKRMN